MLDPRYRPGILALPAILFTISYVLITIPRGPLQFAPAALPEAQVGVPYEACITSSQHATPAGRFSISEGRLPKGLALERIEGADSARIFGTPGEAGTFTFKVYVWCYGTNVSGQTGEQQYVVTVK